MAKLNAEALEQADPESREGYEQATLPTLRSAQLRVIRDKHVRRLLDIPEQPAH
jgi:hypothetical protein